MAYRATVNLRVLAGVAKPNPKMGQALGPLGINMMQFCKVKPSNSVGIQRTDICYPWRRSHEGATDCLHRPNLQVYH